MSNEKLVSCSAHGHIIDCGVNPVVPIGQTLEEHDTSEPFVFDPSKITFYIDEAQRNSGGIEGNLLRNKLADKRVLNANVLDFLLLNPELIPEEWKTDDAGRTRFIYFWGTRYTRYSSECIRCLYWNGHTWFDGTQWLNDEWKDTEVAAVRAD